MTWSRRHYPPIQSPLSANADGKSYVWTSPVPLHLVSRLCMGRGTALALYSRAVGGQSSGNGRLLSANGSRHRPFSTLPPVFHLTRGLQAPPPGAAAFCARYHTPMRVTGSGRCGYCCYQPVRAGERLGGPSMARRRRRRWRRRPVRQVK